MVLGELRSWGADHLSGRRRLATFGAGIAATVLVAGIFAVLDVAQVVVGTTPTVADSSCQDTWTGRSPDLGLEHADELEHGGPERFDRPCVHHGRCGRHPCRCIGLRR